MNGICSNEGMGSDVVSKVFSILKHIVNELGIMGYVYL